MAANQSYRDDGAFQVNPSGSNTQNRSHKSIGAFQPQKAVSTSTAWQPLIQDNQPQPDIRRAVAI